MNSDGTYESRMKAAKEKDKNSSKSNKIVRYLHMHLLSNTTLITFSPQSPGDRSLRVVHFHILRSLPDLHPNPIIAKRER